jgi:hypothetical protein
VRSGDFYPSVLEKGTRTDQAVNLALVEMYVQGISTRRVIGTIATPHRVWYAGKQPRPEVCSSLMKAGFSTICSQRVRGDSMPIAASATCYYPAPCAPWPALRRQEVGCLRQGSGRKLFRGPKNCQPHLQHIVAKGEKRPQQS